MSFRLVVWLLCALGPWSLAQGTELQKWDLPTLMDALAHAPAGEVRFTERKTLHLLKEPLILSGKLDYQRPSRLEKRVTTPFDERYLVDGDRLTVIRPAKEIRQEMALSDYPALQAFVESIRAPLAGDMATLRRFYRVSLGGSSRNWLLALVPLEADMAQLVRVVQVRGNGNRLSEIRIEEASGDQSVMTIESAP